LLDHLVTEALWVGGFELQHRSIFELFFQLCELLSFPSALPLLFFFELRSRVDNDAAFSTSPSSGVRSQLEVLGYLMQKDSALRIDRVRKLDSPAIVVDLVQELHCDVERYEFKQLLVVDSD